MVFATGTITGVNFTTSVVHSVRYRHRSNPLAPPHGTLLNATGVTDDNGLVTFDVSYADDATLIDEIDSITVADL